MTRQKLSCFVLGGGGFVGTNLCRVLTARGHRVAAFGRSCVSRDAIAGVEWHQGLYPNAPSLAPLLAGFDVFVHLVHSSTPASSSVDIEGDLKTNLLPAVELMRVVCDSGVKRFVYASSGGTVYGPQAPIPTPETASTDPVTGYGASKLAIEKYLGVFHHLRGLDYRVLRFGNLYGPYQHSGTLGIIPVLIDRARRGQEVTVWGDGSIIRDFLYVSDAIEAMVSLITGEPPARIFNIGSGNGRSIRQVISEIEVRMGVPMKVRFESARKFDVPVSILSVERARKELGWTPTTAFGDGIAKTLAWWDEARA